ncbi:MAG: hypothetical protein JSW67_08425 [Candidatus Latescibacterota bacterium]|nr:MAG: hypothetical protein JSW67_08425 [Candidatus Latescibacterota bacterium]
MLLSILPLLLLAAPVWAYEGVEVENAGSLTGRVRLEGQPPAAVVTEVHKNVSVCGTTVEDRTFVVGEGGALANVVVYLAAVGVGRPIDLEAIGELDNRECRFEPHVQSLTVGQKIEIKNSDPVLHNTRTEVLGGGIGNRINLAMARAGTTIRKPIRYPGIHRLRCDAGHTWMNAYLLVFEHPYHVVTGTDGTFELDEVPPGEYTLMTWHEKLGTSETKIGVKAGELVEVPAIVLKQSQ